MVTPSGKIAGGWVLYYQRLHAPRRSLLDVRLYFLDSAAMIARAFRQLAMLLALATAPALVSGVVQLKWQQPPPPAAGEISFEATRKLDDQVLWVDARSRVKFAREHIPGAVLLNEDDWVRLVGPFLEAWAPEKTIVVYCDGGSCDASHHVARRIKEELQIENPVWVLQGGWDTWLRQK